MYLLLITFVHNLTHGFKVLFISFCLYLAEAGQRESTIIFKCDENGNNGSPQLLSETLGCSVTFEWRTQLLCPPRKMECKFIQKHKTYDLRILSSLTGSWVFADKGSS